MKNMNKIFTGLLIAFEMLFVFDATALSVCTTSRNGKHLVVTVSTKKRVKPLYQHGLPSGYQVPETTNIEISKCVNGDQQVSEKYFAKCPSGSNLSKCKLYYQYGMKIHICDGANQLANNVYEFSSDPKVMCYSCSEWEDLKGGKCVASKCIYQGKMYSPGTTIYEGSCQKIDNTYVENSSQWENMNSGKECQVTCHNALQKGFNNKAVAVSSIKTCPEGKTGVRFGTAKNFKPALSGYKQCVKGSARPTTTSTSQPTSTNVQKTCPEGTFLENNECVNVSDIELDDSLFDNQIYDADVPTEAIQYETERITDIDFDDSLFDDDVDYISDEDLIQLNGENEDDTILQYAQDRANEKKCANITGAVFEKGECKCKDSDKEIINNKCTKKKRTTDKTVSRPNQTGQRNTNTDTNSEQQALIEGAITSINTQIKNGIKVGDKLSVDTKLILEPALKKYIDQWERACKNATKPDNATKLYASVDTTNPIRVCKIQTCKKGYGLSADETKCDKQNVPNDDPQPNKNKCPKNSGAVWDDAKGKCVCEDPDEEMVNGKCVDIENGGNNVNGNGDNKKEGKSCTDKNNHIKKGKFNNELVCIPQKCDDGYVTSEDGKNCIECNIVENAISMTSRNNKCVIKECTDGYKEKDGKCVEKTKNSKDDENDDKDEPKPKKVDPEEMAKKQKAYDEALANEQSMANRTLTAATTAATGIGAMEALQGLAEQKSDKAADADMNAYISTMRCKYGNTSVKMGADEIELPGGNDENMMKYRAEYIALAADLKERKSALNMAPGIESIEVLDKSTMGLYDDESVGITSGNYSSLYRAKALGSESDQAQIDEAAKTSKTRVIAGAAAAGVGVVGGTVGNFIINNQETKQRIEEAKAKRNARQLQNTALNKLKSCLAEAGVTGTNSLEFKNLIPTMFTLDNIDCKTDLTNLKGKKAQDLFADTTDENVLCDKLIKSFGLQLANKLAGCDDILENSDDDN